MRVWWRTCWLSKWGYKTETFLLTTPIFLEPGKERLRKRSFLPLLSSHMPHFLSSHSFFFFFFWDIGNFFLEHWSLLISYYTHTKTSSLVCHYVSCSLTTTISSWLVMLLIYCESIVNVILFLKFTCGVILIPEVLSEPFWFLKFKKWEFLVPLSIFVSLFICVSYKTIIYNFFSKIGCSLRVQL